MRRRIAASLAAAAAAILAGGAAVASADGGHAQSSTAQGVAAGPFHFDFNATRPAGAPSNQASGVFDANLIVAGKKVVHVKGPVTCLDVRGNSVGLFYPLSGSEPAAFGKLVRGIYIYMRVDGKGHATGAAFSQSVRPYAASCPPIPAVVPATGHGTADS